LGLQLQPAYSELSTLIGCIKERRYLGLFKFSKGKYKRYEQPNCDKQLITTMLLNNLTSRNINDL